MSIQGWVKVRATSFAREERAEAPSTGSGCLRRHPEPVEGRSLSAVHTGKDSTQALANYYGADLRVGSFERYPCEACVGLAVTCGSVQRA